MSGIFRAGSNRKKLALSGFIILLSMLALVLNLIGESRLVPSATCNAGSAIGPWLEVRELRVMPIVLRSGTPARIEAVVVNCGTVPVYGLQLGVAVAEVGAVNRGWVPLDKYPSEPIETLVPGKEVNFRGLVRLEGDGWFLVGVAGIATNAILLPRGKKVRVVNPMESLMHAVMLFAFYAVLLSIAVIAARVLMGWGKGKALLIPQYSLIGSGLLVMVMGFSWFGVFRYVAPLVQPQILSWLPLGGVILFAGGWVLIGAGLRPQGKAWRGMLLAVVLYTLIGIGWVVGFNISLGAGFTELAHPTLLLIALVWPLQVTQVLGIFGLGLY